MMPRPGTRAGDGWTPLHLAAQSGHLGVVRLLREMGADLNKADDDGATPLFVAAQNGRHEVARLLVEMGADLNKARAHDGLTALEASLKHPAATTELLALGAQALRLVGSESLGGAPAATRTALYAAGFPLPAVPRDKNDREWLAGRHPVQLERAETVRAMDPNVDEVWLLEIIGDYVAMKPGIQRQRYEEERAAIRAEERRRAQ